MSCYDKLQQRVRQALADLNTPANSLLARLKDEFGVDSDTAVDNIITMLFAGKQLVLICSWLFCLSEVCAE